MAQMALALSLVLAAPLHAGPLARADDLRRLERLDEAAGEALLGAFAAGDPQDLNIVADALAGTPLPPAEAMAYLPGDWQCRMIKMGENGLPLVVYPDFRCVATADGSFEKRTGSQRTKGQISPEGDALIYLGTGFIAGDDPPAYADLPAATDPATTPQRLPEIGRVELTGPNSGRILFPLPHVESRFNILMLSR
jgi:hypothetical protein